MMIRLIGRFDVIPDEWRDIDYVLSMMGRTSMQELPDEIKKFARDFPKADELPRTWMVLKNSTPRFIRSVSVEDNTMDRPYDVTDEMYKMLQGFWFASVKDFFVFSGGELYTAQMVRNYLNQVMRQETDIARMLIDPTQKHYTQNIYTRAWAYYFMFNHSENLGDILKNKETSTEIFRN